jgi:hypothetical protein
VPQRIRIPLADSDADVRLELQSVVNHAYETGAYHDRPLYERACQPPLSPDDQTWADNLIAQAGIDRQAP